MLYFIGKEYIFGFVDNNYDQISIKPLFQFVKIIVNFLPCLSHGNIIPVQEINSDR